MEMLCRQIEVQWRRVGKEMKGKKIGLLMIPLALGFVGLTVWGPEAMARYRDTEILNRIQSQEAEVGTEGYRYSLSNNDKVYILSECLKNQVPPESEQNAMTRKDTDYQGLTGTYALVVNRQGIVEEEEGESGTDLCNRGMEELKELGIMPEEVRALTDSAYSAVLYSAIDVPEPRNNVWVWKISLNTQKQNANKENRLLDAYVDADTGKIYEFYVRTEVEDWRDLDPDAIVRTWAEYLELGEPEEFENVNPLAENTPYFKKYVFEGMDGGSTVVTIGYYEGIRELYLKIS